MYIVDFNHLNEQPRGDESASQIVEMLGSATAEPVAGNLELPGVLSDHGTLLYREAMPPTAMQEMERMARDGLRRLMDQPEKCPSQHEFNEQFRSVIPYPLDVHLGTNFLQILAILGHSPALPVLQSYFGTDDLVVPFGSMLARYVEPRSGEGTVYWHQDGTTI
tara:strand:- start:494 stop:985 length:492 start_codon:yes stop_codon:yes gene_type:complete